MNNKTLREIALEAVNFVSQNMDEETTRREFSDDAMKVSDELAQNRGESIPIEYRAAFIDVFEKEYDAIQDEKEGPFGDNEFSLTQHAIKTYADNTAMVFMYSQREGDLDFPFIVADLPFNAHNTLVDIIMGAAQANFEVCKDIDAQPEIDLYGLDILTPYENFVDQVTRKMVDEDLGCIIIDEIARSVLQFNAQAMHNIYKNE